MFQYPFTSSTTDNFISQKPSTHAVAMMRAIHQLIDKPIIFPDPLAIPILGLTEASLSKKMTNHQDFLSTAIRISIAIRSRYANDQRQAAKAQHVYQHIILGAGLDTYAYRNISQGEKIFEVDLNQVQQIKLQQLRKNGIASATTIHYVTCNFETDNLERKLAEAGFDNSQPAFFSLLGVTPYLSKSASETIFAFISRCAKGSHLVFDYMSEPSILNPPERIGLEITCASLAEGGEPVKSFYAPSSIKTQFAQLGFSQQHDVTPEELNSLYLAGRSDGVQVGRVLRLFKAVV